MNYVIDSNDIEIMKSEIVYMLMYSLGLLKTAYYYIFKRKKLIDMCYDYFEDYMKYKKETEGRRI